MKGKIHSFQSLGTLDGPGVRFVVFMHGCNLHCGYCHNIDVVCGECQEYSPEEIMVKILKYKEYFGDDGGVTVSGGEPLLQTEFLKELFTLCRENNIHTVIDTSGSIISGDVIDVLKLTDMVLLDIKMPNDELYRKHIGCSIKTPMEFLKILNEMNIECYIRQVIVEGINDNEDSMKVLKEIRKGYQCIKKIELLPFHKMCIEKYEKLGIEFPFSKYPKTSKETIERLYLYL